MSREPYYELNKTKFFVEVRKTTLEQAIVAYTGEELREMLGNNNWWGSEGMIVNKSAVVEAINEFAAKAKEGASTFTINDDDLLEVFKERQVSEFIPGMRRVGNRFWLPHKVKRPSKELKLTKAMVGQLISVGEAMATAFVSVGGEGTTYVSFKYAYYNYTNVVILIKRMVEWDDVAKNVEARYGADRVPFFKQIWDDPKGVIEKLYGANKPADQTDE